MLTNLDLFSGIGGFSYVFHKKIKTIGYCDTSEISKNALRSLMDKDLIDSAPIFHDVSTLSKTDLPCIPDMITGGFPCQDISHANKSGKGLDGKRSSLFYQIIRLCDEIPNIKHVFLENVGRVVNNGIIEKIYEPFINMGFQVQHVIVTAKQVGAPHTRRRCFIIATKDIETLRTVHLDLEYGWANPPENMVRVDNLIEKNKMKHRCCLCGNSVVPACVSSAFNHMVHGHELPSFHNPIDIVMKSGETVFKRSMWGTPYASFNLYKPYRLQSMRSSGVLFNQIWYSELNEDKRTCEWTVNPVFLEWMMGYPEDYTKT